MQHHSP